MKISKELLSEVLPFKNLEDRTWQYKLIDNNICIIYNINKYFEGNIYQINIYELAFKLKDWAFKNNRELYSSTRGHCYISNLNRNNPSNIIDHYAETEVEAIIKACEWLLKEVNEK